jgi:RHS repeat-associated protein
VTDSAARDELAWEIKCVDELPWPHNPFRCHWHERFRAEHPECAGQDTAAGDVAEQLDYDSFGNITSDSNPGFQPFGFAGGLYDRDTGLLHLGAREYDPKTGRFTTRDPLGFGGGDANLYGYVLDDPVNAVDPSGEGWALSGIVHDIGNAANSVANGAMSVGNTVGNAGKDALDWGAGHWQQLASGASFAVCVAASAGACVGVAAFVLGANVITDIQYAISTGCTGSAILRVLTHTGDAALSIIPAAPVLRGLTEAALPVAKAAKYAINAYLALPGLVTSELYP